MGEKYEFDFEGSMDENIKILRNFVKEKMPKRAHKDKNDEKLPKILKMFQDEENGKSHSEESISKKKEVAKVEESEQMFASLEQLSLRSRRRSESDISSLQTIWFLNNQPNSALEDEDSFFRAFKKDEDEDFIEFGHLM